MRDVVLFVISMAIAAGLTLVGTGLAVNLFAPSSSYVGTGKLPK